MDILKQEDSNRGQFYIEDEDGKTIAFLVYRYEKDNLLVIEHTEVDPSLKGQGIGAKLVAEAVDFARRHNLTIKPLCSYAAAMFKKNSSYKDVLAA